MTSDPKITPINPDYVLVSLEQAKIFLSVDYPDWDDLIEQLIDAAISASQKSTGKLYQPCNVTIITDECEDVFPYKNTEWYKPVSSEPMPNSFFARTYTYPSGYEEGSLPPDLRQAILQRVAEGFKYREDTQEAALHATSNASVFTEFSYRSNPMI